MADRETLPCDALTCWEDNLGSEAEQAELLRECFDDMHPGDCCQSREDECSPDSWMQSNANFVHHFHVNRLPPERRSDQELAAGVNEVEQRWNDYLDGETDEAGYRLEMVYYDRIRTRGHQIVMNELNRKAKRRTRVLQRLNSDWNFDPRLYQLVVCVENKPVLKALDRPASSRSAPTPRICSSSAAKADQNSDCPLDWDKISIL